MLNSFDILLPSLFERTLYWITRNIDHFSLPDHKSINSQSEASIVSSTEHKAFGELAIICLVMNRYSQVRQREEFKVLTTYIEEALHQSNFTFDMTRRTGLFEFYLSTYLCLKACDLKVYIDAEQFKILLQKMIDEDFIDAIERTPCNQIELSYYFNLGGFKHQLFDCSSIYKYSSAFRLPSPIHLRPIDAYCLTHIIFYLSDFGQQTLVPILQERYNETYQYIILLLGIYTRKRDWDLVAELLICCNFMQCDYFHPLIQLAGKCLGQAQHPEGFIPGKDRFLEKLEDDLENNNSEKDAFRMNYHPTLVTFLTSIFYLYGEDYLK
jgi:hypothetical protein